MIPFNFHGNVKQEVAYVNAVVDVMHTNSLQSSCTVELLDCILLGYLILCFDTCLPLEKKIHEVFIYNQNSRSSKDRVKQKTVHPCFPQSVQNLMFIGPCITLPNE